MGVVKDMWRVGLVRAPMADLLKPGALAEHPVTWIPDPGPLRFLADPMGVWRDGRLYVFAEIYDYRDRIGAIEVLTFDADLQLLSREPALKEPWHLSYPFIIEEGGETYMLPEAHKSGRLTLYRAEAFPTKWTPVGTIELDQVAIDATPVFHDGRWWLFYTPATTKAEKVSALHVAWADRITGPWTPHPGNPVRFDPSSSRPGGTPIVVDGAIVLPMQDCRRTYGGAIRALRVTILTPDRFEADADAPIAPPPAFGKLTDGLHTLSAAGPVTLIDAKRFEVSPRSLALDVRWEWAKRVRKRARTA
ncbi:family 43 glycosylhydrolase [Caulobacter sp. UNC358MFTsu5.1]|uniref:glucosamine inositolphosphorylceramide transferase family protein n=1 Tax=Caulobacter sp. UNC358MFTsu5.1 TaxID=1449049 RepID=UPI0004A76DA0|nr:family 43 glycosylhydrolase [Caulobacter sp. UNC358MFTsu5.1]